MWCRRTPTLPDSDQQLGSWRVLLGVAVAVLATLEPATRESVALLTVDRQQLFQSEFGKRMHHADAIVLLAIFFPIQLFFLGNVALGVAFWLTLGGLDVWWVIECFLTPGCVRTANNEIAQEVLSEMAEA